MISTISSGVNFQIRAGLSGYVAELGAARTDIHVPCERLIWIGVEPPPKAVTNCTRFSRDVVRRQRALTAPQVGPTFFDFGQFLGM